VDFEVFPGEVHVLVGENSAGKSTLMKILGGIIPPDGGELRIAGETATLANAQDARKNGVAFIHQELNLCANLDVAHNIFLGHEPCRRGLTDAGEMVRRSAELLKALGADLDPRSPVSRLSTAQQQLVEIAKAMSFKSRVVIMDEPTASLTKREIDMLFDLIRRMRADGMSGGNQQKCVLGKWLSTAPRLLMLDEPTRGIDVGAKAQIRKLIDQIADSGVAILMISTELPELIGSSDRVYVMREGRVVSELEAGPDLTQERVVAYMV
jgi:ABC-type sugar transport system ATPase subunit